VYAGVLNTVTVTGINLFPSQMDPSGTGPCNTTWAVSIGPLDAYGNGNIAPLVPGVGGFSQTSASSYLLSIEPEANAPTETALFTVYNLCDGQADQAGCGGNFVIYWMVSYPINIVNKCPAPAITSVTPSVWFAGKSYKVKVTGANFTTSAEAVKKSCPVTTAAITAADGSAVPIGNVNVDSATQITLTGVAPPDSDPTQAATITAGTSPSTGTYSTLDIVGAAQIQCDAPAMECDGRTISGAGASAQTAVVGQTISLATTPTAATLAALPVPLSFSKDKPTTWTLTDGTNIGGLKPGPPISNGSPRTMSIAPTVLNKPELTTYWLYPKCNVPVKYKFCVTLPDGSDQCAPEATATFNVVGPTAKITPILSELADPENPATGTWSVSGKFPACPINPRGLTQFLIFGRYDPPAATCNPTVGLPGIVFEATDVNTDSVAALAPNGYFRWAQLLIPGGQDSLTRKNGTVKTTPIVTGLDEHFPAFVGATAQDAPSIGVRNAFTAATREFKADMYLMWYSNLDANAVAVPIGYETWSVDGTENNLPPWALAPGTELITAQANYTPSSANQDNYGMPVWTRVVLGSKFVNNEELDSAQSDGEAQTVRGDGGEETQQ
jgi:hypothetical protein